MNIRTVLATTALAVALSACQPVLDMPRQHPTPRPVTVHDELEPLRLEVTTSCKGSFARIDNLGISDESVGLPRPADPTPVPTVVTDATGVVWQGMLDDSETFDTEGPVTATVGSVEWVYVEPVSPEGC